MTIPAIAPLLKPEEPEELVPALGVSLEVGVVWAFPAATVAEELPDGCVEPVLLVMLGAT